MNSEAFVFDPRPDYQLRLSVQRYWHPEYCSTDDDALTLVFSHCVGGHKEQWEPTLQHLFSLAGGSHNAKIREAWSIDAPEHGDSAILNDHLLTQAMDWRPESSLTWEDNARSVHMFLSGLGTGVNVDFRSRRLVLVGHSLGAAVLVLSTIYHPRINMQSMILVDPMIIRKPKPGESNLEFSDSIGKRKDIWDSRKAALRYFSSARQWKDWDRRVIRLYAEHAVRDLPTETYPGRTHGVTLKCTRRQEAALYRDRLCSLRAFEYLPTLCQRLPVHLIRVEHADFIPPSFLEDIPTKGTQGLHASSRTIPGVGHLVVQTHPERLAEAIMATLVQNSVQGVAGSAALSRL